MTKDEALRLAWGALEDIGDEWGFTSQRTVPKRKEAITAIKESLAQPEQEPIGQLCEESYGRGQVMWFNKPVDGSYVYTAPPQRTWVGLTNDEEIWETISRIGTSDSDVNPYAKLADARAIEAKLKEKNT